MVIINERPTRNGRKVYDLEELTTGQKKTWSPPNNLDKTQYRAALLHFATRFEAETQLPSSEEYKIAATPCRDLDADANTPFGLYATQVFMPRKMPVIAENTRDGWERFLRLRILPAIGDIPIGSISPGKLTDFLLGMQAEGLAKQTVDRYYTFLRAIFKMAYKTDVIATNPMEKVDKPKCRSDECLRTEVDACTAEEIAQILQCIRKEPRKWQVIINLLIETGMRIGECMALKWEDIDWKSNAVTIRASLGYTARKGVYTTTPKNKRSRVVYVSNDMMMLLLQHYRDNVMGGPNSPYINHQDNSAEPMHPQSPGKYLRRFGDRYGFPGLHPHKLRHSYASIAITNGADVASVADNLGHRDSSVTLRIYTSANETSKRSASNICRSAVQCAALAL